MESNSGPGSSYYKELFSSSDTPPDFSPDQMLSQYAKIYPQEVLTHIFFNSLTVFESQNLKNFGPEWWERKITRYFKDEQETVINRLISHIFPSNLNGVDRKEIQKNKLEIEKKIYQTFPTLIKHLKTIQIVSNLQEFDDIIKSNQIKQISAQELNYLGVHSNLDGQQIRELTRVTSCYRSVFDPIVDTVTLYHALKTVTKDTKITSETWNIISIFLNVFIDSVKDFKDKTEIYQNLFEFVLKTGNIDLIIKVYEVFIEKELSSTFEGQDSATVADKLYSLVDLEILNSSQAQGAILDQLASLAPNAEVIIKLCDRLIIDDLKALSMVAEGDYFEYLSVKLACKLSQYNDLNQAFSNIFEKLFYWSYHIKDVNKVLNQEKVEKENIVYNENNKEAVVQAALSIPDTKQRSIALEAACKLFLNGQIKKSFIKDLANQIPDKTIKKRVLKEIKKIRA